MGSKNELKKIDTCYRTCYHFDNIIKTQDVDLDNILIYEKSYEIFQFLIFHIKLYVLDSIKQVDILEFIIELEIQYYLEMGYMIPFTTVLDIL